MSLHPACQAEALDIFESSHSLDLEGELRLLVSATREDCRRFGEVASTFLKASSCYQSRFWGMTRIWKNLREESRIQPLAKHQDVLKFLGRPCADRSPSELRLVLRGVCFLCHRLSNVVIDVVGHIVLPVSRS